MMKIFRPFWLPVCIASIAFSCVGCGGSTEPKATSGDELSQYLDENPELKEIQDHAPPSDPRSSN
ncbi:hypothetical protein CA85_28580 [Allorhodopirellula solitaria]|uniref:Uncharacterized protein n=1 Tax=Allorhodopirellula solitaria TaxID=2527987 RepID=A0A5C5XTT6_9BACT|nr:hypothetical protein CA85_28580 [Allorhodopirellula solitaria]